MAVLGGTNRIHFGTLISGLNSRCFLVHLIIADDEDSNAADLSFVLESGSYPWEKDEEGV